MGVKTPEEEVAFMVLSREYLVAEKDFYWKWVDRIPELKIRIAQCDLLLAQIDVELASR